MNRMSSVTRHRRLSHCLIPALKPLSNAAACCADRSHDGDHRPSPASGHDTGKKIDPAGKEGGEGTRHLSQ